MTEPRLPGDAWEGLSSADREVRLRALSEIREAAARGDDWALDALRRIVRDHRGHDIEIWSRALNDIDVFGDPSLRQPLVDAIRDETYGGQAYAAAACAVVGAAEAVPTLIALLRHPQPFTRTEAAAALGPLGDDAAVPALERALFDEHEHTRQAAAEALAEIASAEALDALWRALLSRRVVRPHYLANAIAQFGDLVIDRLVALAHDEDPNLRYWVARALGSTGHPSAVPVLEAMVEHDIGRTDPFIGEVRTAARQALATHRRVTRHRSGADG